MMLIMKKLASSDEIDFNDKINLATQHVREGRYHNRILMLLLTSIRIFQNQDSCCFQNFANQRTLIFSVSVMTGKAYTVLPEVISVIFKF